MQVKQSGWKTRAVITAMVLYAVCNVIMVRSRLTEAESYRQALTERAAGLRAENEALERSIAEADNPTIIEAIARARLGLVRPGEKIFCNINS